MKKALIGYGGMAKEVMAQMGVKLTCFVEEEYVEDGVLPLKEFNPKEYALIVAIADPVVRKKIVEQLPKTTKYFTFIHPTALIMGDIEIGEGSFIGAYTILTTNIKIGSHAIINRGNQIGHDCHIGNYFSCMPGAIVSGNVKINNSVYLGTNSTVRENVTITDSVKIGLNSGVVNDINEHGVYVGCPTKKIK
jgi:sugar O-acyltransferase (sialic acid O-acetyltransferase NeuD family)